jgi:hypothetical protein
MEEGHVAKLLPARTRSKRTRSTTASREPHHGDRSKASATSSSTPRTSRPGLTSRTSSAPLVPLASSTKLLVIEDDLDDYSQRDSVASIKDDPFFRNYQSPSSVSMANELRSATYDEDVAEELPARSARRPSADAVNLPVCLPPSRILVRS